MPGRSARGRPPRLAGLVWLLCLFLAGCGGGATTISPTSSPSAGAARSSSTAVPTAVPVAATVASAPTTAATAPVVTQATGKPAGAGQKVALVFPGPGTLIFLPFEVAKAQGFFTQQGLDVEFTYAKGGPPAVNALTSGSADFAGTTIDLALNSAKQGKTITMVTSLTRLPAFAVVSTNDKVAGLKDLEGKKVGITNVGAGDQLILRYLIKKQGGDPDKVEYVAVGPDEAKINAANAHQIDAAILQEPALSILTSKGAKVLANLYDPQQAKEDLGGGYQFTGLVSRPEVIRDRAGLVQKMVNAVVMAERFIAAHPGDEIVKGLPDQAIVGDHAAFIKIVDRYKQAMYSADGMIHPEEAQAVVRVQQESGALTGQPPDVTRFYTNKFVEATPR